MKTTIATAFCILALAGTVSLAEPDRGERRRDRDGDPRDMPAAAVERGRGGQARSEEPRVVERRSEGPRVDERRSEGPRVDERRSEGPRGGNFRGAPAANDEPTIRESRAPADTWRGGAERRGDNGRGAEPRAGGPRGGDARVDESRGRGLRGDDARGNESRGDSARGGDNSRGGDVRVAPPRMTNRDDGQSHRDGRRDYNNDYRRGNYRDRYDRRYDGRNGYRDHDRYRYSYWDKRGRGWHYEPRWYQSYRHTHFRYYGGRYYGRQRFQISFYVFPRGFSYRNWRVGEYMPYSYYYNARYDLDDYWRYDLYDPPYWAHWVRVGNDALLIDYDNREVIDVVYDLFY